MREALIFSFKILVPTYYDPSNILNISHRLNNIRIFAEDHTVYNPCTFSGKSML